MNRAEILVRITDENKYIADLVTLDLECETLHSSSEHNNRQSAINEAILFAKNNNIKILSPSEEEYWR